MLRRLASLQMRLMALLTVALLVVWLGAAVLTWLDASEEVGELLDSHLAQAAALLVLQQTHIEDGDEDDVGDTVTLHKYAPKVAFQVFHNGKLVMRSSNAGEARLSQVRSGFDTVTQADGARWRVFAAHGAERDIQVYVGEQARSRSDILWAVLRGMLLPLLLALPLLALLMWWAVRTALAPIRRLSDALAGRAAQALEPVVVPDVPLEMQPLVIALNDLLLRIERMVASERRFTADAAHELRTPIAAIRAQAQVAMGAGADAVQRLHALQFTLAGCDRAAHLVDQLLVLARLEAGGRAQRHDVDGTANLAAVARQIAADLAPAALARGQVLALDVPPELGARSAVPGNDLLVGMLLRNLLDNALRYSPDGAQVLVQIQSVPQGLQLRVQDSGPGLQEADLQRLGERFFRVLGSTQPGSGLGWSIVRRIAQSLGATVSARRSPDLGGLLVEVEWPQPAKMG
jgi:two-component system sensor histidine kinase QseC